MDLALLVYIISVLGSIGPLLTLMITASIVCLTTCILFRHIDLSYEAWDSEKTRKYKEERRSGVDKWIRISFVCLILTSLLQVIIPSEKTAYVMVGAYATQKIAENDKVQETGQKVLTIINQKLDLYVEEGIETAKKKAESVKSK